MLALAGQAVELDQRQLDLLVAVSSRASGPGRAEGRRARARRSARGCRAAAAGRWRGNRRCRPRAGGRGCRARGCRGGWSSACRARAEIPAVEVAVRRLRAFEVVDDRLDLRLDVVVAAVRQRVGRGLDPLADVGVPEHLHGEVVLVAREAQRRRRVGQRQGVEDAVGCELGVLARDGAGQHGLEPLAPELALDLHIDEPHRPELAHVPIPSPTDDCRTTSEHGRRATPPTGTPSIISSSRSPASRPERPQVHVDAGQRRPGGERHHVPVVEADDGDVAAARRGRARAARRPRRGRSGRCRRRARPAARPRRRAGRRPRGPRPPTRRRAGRSPAARTARRRRAPPASRTGGGGPPRSAPAR